MLKLKEKRVNRNVSKEGDEFIERVKKNIEDRKLKRKKIKRKLISSTPKQEIERRKENWRLRKFRLILEEKNWKVCEVCKQEFEYLHLHHHTYMRKGKEKLEDVALVCKDCHSNIHTLDNWEKTHVFDLVDRFNKLKKSYSS